VRALDAAIPSPFAGAGAYAPNGRPIAGIAGGLSALARRRVSLNLYSRIFGGDPGPSRCTSQHATVPLLDLAGVAGTARRGIFAPGQTEAAACCRVARSTRSRNAKPEIYFRSARFTATDFFVPAVEAPTKSVSPCV